jgi:hypothetical protein
MYYYLDKGHPIVFGMTNWYRPPSDTNTLVCSYTIDTLSCVWWCSVSIISYYCSVRYMAACFDNSSSDQWDIYFLYGAESFRRCQQFLSQSRKVPVFYRTCKVITVITRACHF